MTRKNDKYAEYVDHPRYGRHPIVTGLNPGRSIDEHIHWHSPKECRIPNTAISANVSRQTLATVHVTHYYDVTRVCRDCSLQFIFFAKEQKHWYEELGFGLNSDCVRCVPCRKSQQGSAKEQGRYEELFHVPKRTEDQNLEMADCCLSLIESSTFTRSQLVRVRMLLNKISSDPNFVHKTRYNKLLARVLSLEEQGDN